MAIRVNQLLNAHTIKTINTHNLKGNLMRSRNKNTFSVTLSLHSLPKASLNQSLAKSPLAYSTSYQRLRYA